MSEPFSKRRVQRSLQRASCVIGLLMGACGGMGIATFAYANDTGLFCHPPLESCRQSVESDVDPRSPFTRPQADIIMMMLLGCGMGSMVGLAIAPLLQHRTTPPSSSLLPPPSSLDLSQFKSSDIPLTQHQRDVLQCLWLMAAIAPPTPQEPSSDEPPVPPTTSTWEWCLEQIQQSAIARDEIVALLTDMGFSQKAVQTAWNIAHATAQPPVTSLSQKR